MQIKNAIYIALFLLFHSSLSAWWDAGHMAVAQIGYEELRPEAKEKVDKYLKAVSGPFPHYSDFVMASLWADDIIKEGINSFREWHGSARPYDPYKILSEREHEKILFKFENNDIVWAIRECLATIKKENSSLWAKGFMLRMLIHIVGDIHQPSHCISLYSPDFPNGDVAGTRFHIKHESYKTHHALFDAAFGLANRKPERPISEEDRIYLAHLVNYLKSQYPRDSLSQLNNKNIDHWRQESYDIGAGFGYAKIFPNEQPSPDVMQEGRYLTGKQLALAGYRLADLLNDLLTQ